MPLVDLLGRVHKKLIRPWIWAISPALIRVTLSYSDHFVQHLYVLLGVGGWICEKKLIRRLILANYFTCTYHSCQLTPHLRVTPPTGSSAITPHMPSPTTGPPKQKCSPPWPTNWQMMLNKLMCSTKSPYQMFKSTKKAFNTCIFLYSCLN